MDIRELRLALDFSQQQFASYFGIPVGTIRNWEQGKSNPPAYVISMIEKILERDEMINLETIKFMKLIDRLSSLIKAGVDDFANATQDNYHDKLYYDGRFTDEKGRYRLVWDACVVDDPECYHHDVVAYYDDFVSSGGYKVRLLVPEEDGKVYFDECYIEITFDKDDSLITIDRDGAWNYI